MQKENKLTVGQWCDYWFTANRRKWNGNTEGGYRNLIYSHILPGIGSVALSDLTEQVVTDFYNSLRSQGLGARSVWCVHLLLRRCMDEAAQDQLIPYNPVRLCQEPKAEEYKTAPLRLGQLQRYLNAAEQLGVLPVIYTGLSSGLRQCELITLSWADFYVRYRYILKGRRLLTLNEKAVHTPNVEFSFDVAIIKKNPNGNYMRLVHNKPWNQYTWNEVPRSHQVKDRADDIKEEGLWQEVRDKYLEKKNMYLSWQDHNHPSFVVYVEAVNEVYNRYFNRGGGYSVQSIF